MSNAAPLMPGSGTAIAPKVNLKRPKPWKALEGQPQGPVVCSSFFGLLFWVCFFLQFALLIQIYASVNSSGSFECRDFACPDGTSRQYCGYELGDSLKTDFCQCKANRGRRLESAGSGNSTDAPNFNMFEMMEKHVYVPITGAVMVFAIGFIWLQLLKRLGTAVIVFSLLVNITIMCFLGGLLIHYGATGGGVVILLFAAALAGYSVVRRDRVRSSGRTMETAARGLTKNPAVLAVLVPLEAAFVGYMFLWLEGWAMSTKIKKVADDCSVETDGKYYSNMWGITFLLLWVSFYVDHVKVNVVAASLAHWAFGQQRDGDGCVPLRALRWSFFESSPTLAVTSLVATAVERLKRITQNKCNWANPCCCCLMLIGMVVVESVKMFGRFAVVAHAITGKQFYGAAADAYRLLVKGGNVERAWAADFFSQLSLELFSYALSVGVGMSMWAWVDEAENLGSLKPDGSWQTWFWVFFVFWLILNRMPYFMLFIIMLLGKWQWLADETDGKSSAVLLGMFCCGIARIVFDYFASIVLDAVDTMVMCYAIDKANGMTVAADVAGKKDEVVATMYVILDDLVKEHGGGDEVSAKEQAASTSGLRSDAAVPTAVAVAAPSAPTTTMRVVVPAGTAPGQVLQVTAPSGAVFAITVPAGVVAGQALDVAIPAAV